MSLKTESNWSLHVYFFCRGNLVIAIELFNKAIELARTELEMTHLFSLRDAAASQLRVTTKLNIGPQLLASEAWDNLQSCKYFIRAIVAFKNIIVSFPDICVCFFVIRSHCGCGPFCFVVRHWHLCCFVIFIDCIKSFIENVVWI